MTNVTGSDQQENKAAKAIKSPLKFTLAVQLLVMAPLLVTLNVFSELWMQSFFWGALIYLLPNAYFTFYAFRVRNTDDTQQIAKSFYKGEFGKLFLAVLGFVLVFKNVTPLQVEALLAGYGSLILLQWLIAIQIAKRYTNINC